MILQEIGAAHDTPDDIVFDRFTEAAFRHQTIGRSILGTPETVNSFTPQAAALLSWTATMAPTAWSSVAAGDVNHDDFVREVEATFRRLPQPRHRRAAANTPTMSAAISAKTAT